jgi:hypothetical protein
MSSFRAEAYGVFSALQEMSYAIQHHDANWTLFCDNKALIYRLQSMQSGIYNPEWIDSDVLHSIKYVTPKKGSFRHVRGHQKITKYSDIQTKLNTHVDKLANSAITDPPQEVQLEKSIQVKGETVSLFSTSNIIHFCQKQVSIALWQLRMGLNTYCLVDWNMYERLSTEFKDQVSIIKLFNNLTPTKHRLYKISLSSSPKCPLCQVCEEDYHHVLFCSHNSESLPTSMEVIQQKLIRYGDISQFYITCITNIQHQQSDNNENYQNLQNIIGWSEILRGKTSVDFEHYVKQFMKKERTQRLFLFQFYKLLIIQWKKAWLFRIRQVKQEDDIIITQNIHRNNLKNLIFLYDYKSKINAENRKFMCQSLSEHLTRTPAQINTWMNLHYSSLQTILNQQGITKPSFTSEELDP